MVLRRRGRLLLVLLLAIFALAAIATAGVSPDRGAGGARRTASTAPSRAERPTRGSPLWNRWSGRAGLHGRTAVALRPATRVVPPSLAPAADTPGATAPGPDAAAPDPAPPAPQSPPSAQ